MVSLHELYMQLHHLQSEQTPSSTLDDKTANMVLPLTLCLILAKPAEEGAAVFGRWGEVANAGPEAA